MNSFLQLIWGLTILFLPLLYVKGLTDPINIPQEILIALSSVAGLNALFVQYIATKKLELRTGIGFWLLVLFLTGLIVWTSISPNHIDKLIFITPLLFLVIGYGEITAAAAARQGRIFLAGCLGVGIVIHSVEIMVFHRQTSLFSFLHVGYLVFAAAIIESIFIKKEKLIQKVIFVFLLILVYVASFFSVQYVLSDFIFTQALQAANENNGTLAYQKEIAAIKVFPYRDIYYRSFSQTSIAIANSLLALQTRNVDKPPKKTEQDILNLVQQAIAAGKKAIDLAPANAVNYSNLALVYRSLIGFSVNAGKFAIQNQKKAIALDPINSDEYINLGGIYYQLDQWNNAIQQFQTAVNLKPDDINAYYNRGHAYKQKGDYIHALADYQMVEKLAANNPQNLGKIKIEIQELEKKIK